MSSTTSPPVSLDPTRSILYFDIVVEDYNIEEDFQTVRNNDCDHETALARLQQVFGPDVMNKFQTYSDFMCDQDTIFTLLDLEWTVYKEAGRLLSTTFDEPCTSPYTLSNEGHDAFGDFVCKFAVDDLDHAKRLFALVQKNDSTMDSGVICSESCPYIIMQGFCLSPRGVNSPSFQYANYDWEEWLEELEAKHDKQ